MKGLVINSPLPKKALVSSLNSKCNTGISAKNTPKFSIFNPMDSSITTTINKNKTEMLPTLISLDGCNFTLSIPESKAESMNLTLDKLKAKALKSGGIAQNKQYKANCFRKSGQYKDYVVIQIKTAKMDALVYVGYRPIGNQNALWIRFNPAHFTKFGYKVLKNELAKILGMRLLLKSFANAIPTRLDIAVDIIGITPDYLLADLREARDSAIHLKGGRVSSIAMGTNRSTTAAIAYRKIFISPEGGPQPGTRIEIRLRRMNTTTKPVTLRTLAKCLPANPFIRLDIYQVNEANKLSSTIRLVVAAARALGLKGVLQILDSSDRRIVRKQLELSKVKYFNAGRVWDEVQELLKPLSVLYTEDNV